MYPVLAIDPGQGQVLQPFQRRRAGDFLPDGSYLAEISGGGITLTVRVIEYTAAVAGRDAPELFCLITECATRRCMSGWRWETVHFSAVVAA